MTLIALLLVGVAMVKITIDYKGNKLAKVATQRNNCGKNMEVYSPPRTAMCGKKLRKFGENLQIILYEKMISLGSLGRGCFFIDSALAGAYAASLPTASK